LVGSFSKARGKEEVEHGEGRGGVGVGGSLQNEGRKRRRKKVLFFTERLHYCTDIFDYADMFLTETCSYCTVISY
jgi:hypothetical protein